MKWNRIASISAVVLAAFISGCKQPNIPRLQFEVGQRVGADGKSHIEARSVIRPGTKLFWHADQAFHLTFTSGNPCADVTSNTLASVETPKGSGKYEISCTAAKSLSAADGYPYQITFDKSGPQPTGAQPAPPAPPIPPGDHCEGCVVDPNDQ